MMKLLSSVDKVLLDEQLSIKNINSGVYFSVKDIKTLIQTQNEYKKMVLQSEQLSDELTQQMSNLKLELKSELEKEMPNIEEITARMVKEKLEEQSKKFEWEKE